MRQTRQCDGRETEDVLRAHEPCSCGPPCSECRREENTFDRTTDMPPACCRCRSIAREEFAGSGQTSLEAANVPNPFFALPKRSHSSRHVLGRAKLSNLPESALPCTPN